MQAALKKIFIFCLLLPSVRTIITKYFPCETDMNDTMVDCSDRKIDNVPTIKSATVTSVDLSRTELQHICKTDLLHVPNLLTLKITENCQPGHLKHSDHSCKMEIDSDAFKYLRHLETLNLSGNSLTTIPLLPEKLKILDLSKNRISNIAAPLGTPYLTQLFLAMNCFYANPCHQSYYINESVFRELSHLTNLTLGYNNVTSIPKGLPRSLKSLDLRENRITEVLDRAFANLTSLRYLSLEWNCQRCDHAAQPCFPCPNNDPLRLNPNSLYSENSSITFLSLRGNSLRTFPEGLFRPLKNLRGLDLSDNLLAHALHNGSFFSELESLTWISLIYNYEPLITFPNLTLSSDISKMSDLENLLLSGNFFHKLSDESMNVLSKLKNLHYLELRMNFINSVDLKGLKKLPSLIRINLSQNMLHFLPCPLSMSSGILEKGSSQNQEMDAQNSPEELLLSDGEAASGVDTWESDQSNKLQMFEDDVALFPSLWDFQKYFCEQSLTFDLSQNDIMYLNESVFEGMENVVCLNLSYNYMSQALKQGVFQSMKKVEFLDMSFNRLDFYYREAFSELNKTLRVLDVSNNNFHFNMKGMGHRLEFLQNLSNLEVLSLANNGIGMRIDHKLVSKSLRYLYFNGNHLDIMWAFENNKYTCFFQDLTNLAYLDLSNNGLKSISPEVFCNLSGSIQFLRITENQLRYFPWLNISVLSNLRHLNLSHNSLSSLPSTVIGFGANFSLLDLSHNYISSIPDDFFKEAKSLEYLFLSHNQIKEFNRQFLPVPFRKNSTLRRLTLHKNPFKCDCGTSWFADFLRTSSIQIPYLFTAVHCQYPETQQGKSMLIIDRHSCQDIYGGLAFLVCSFLTVTFTVLPLLKHLFGWDLWYCLQVLWAGHKGYSQLTGKDSLNHYDAFVVFDTMNPAVTDWVYNELTVHLENRGHRRFRLCLEERDWIPGLSCIENLHSAVYSSVKTVFVLSSSACGTETVNGVIRQAFFMVQQRLLDEKVSKSHSEHLMSIMCN